MWACIEKLIWGGGGGGLGIKSLGPLYKALLGSSFGGFGNVIVLWRKCPRLCIMHHIVYHICSIRYP